MPGEPLVCVFQVAASRSEDSVNRTTLKTVSAELGKRLQTCTFIESAYNKHVTEDRVSFSKYQSYVVTSLRTKGVSDHALFVDIENGCWDMLRSSFSSDILKEFHIYQLWKVFNRLVDETSYPPVVCPDILEWFGDKMASSLKKQWRSTSTGNSKDPLTFRCFLDHLTKTLLSTATKDEVNDAVEEMSDWLVEEVLMSGRVWKRTKKQANWTNWTKRWAVLRAGSITYYDSSSGLDSAKKGEILVNRNTQVESLDGYSGMFFKFAHRFKIINKPYIEMEVSPADATTTKAAWIDALNEIIEASRDGTTPMKKLIRQRFPPHTQQKPIANEVEKLSKKLEASAMRTRKQTVKRLQPSVNVTKEPAVVMRASAANGSSTSNRTSLSGDAEDKMRVIFHTIDKNGNGKVDADEFRDFIKSLGLQLPTEETNLIFRSIDRDNSGTITYDEYTGFFSDIIFNESALNISETKLRKAFLSADRDGTGTLNFREFAEYLWDRKRSVRISGLITAFDQFEKTDEGEVEFEDFKRIYQDKLRQDKMPMLEDEDVNDSAVFEKKLKDFYTETDSNDLAKFIRERWNKFATFRRYGGSGDLVMKGGHGMVKDVVPGDYSLLDLALFSDLPPIVPKHVVIKGIEWVKSNTPGKSGQALFPADFDGHVISDVATLEHLRYYGCSFAEGQQLKVSLLYRHGIQDFTYENKYLQEYVTTTNGGAGIERHEFSHLDCPLEDDSGNFILAKIVGDDELHVTAFHVPVRHTLYIPSGVIHCNDYLSGTWRTMLSDETDIDHVHLMRRPKSSSGNAEHFQFNFS